MKSLASDITGTWKADFDTQRGLQKYTFTLKQDGTTVTGKASVDTNGQKREAELKEGKIDGNTVSFVEMLSIQDREIRITFTGKISNNEIKFTRAVGDFGTSEATAKREMAGASAQPSASNAQPGRRPQRRSRWIRRPCHPQPGRQQRSFSEASGRFRQSPRRRRSRHTGAG